MFEALVNRIINEVQKPTIESKKNIFIFKCWNSLRMICENNAFIPLYLNEFDTMLLPVLRVIDVPEILEFEDDLIEILISTVKLSNKLTPNLSKLILLFPNVAKKFHYKVTQLLVAYNTLLTVTPQVFSSQVITDMIDIAANAMNIDNDQSDIYCVYMTEGAMILHLVIQYLHASLTEQHWIGIFSATET